MKIFILTDTHFGHDRLVHMAEGSPFQRPADFTNRILNGFGQIQGDLLIHLGDVCIGNDAQWHTAFLERAHAHFKKVVLVRGNHDGKSDAWYYSQGWDFVCREFFNKVYGKRIVFSHAPIAKENIGGADFNVHGHYHGRAANSHRHEGTMLGGGTYSKDVHRDAAPELHGFSPVNLEELIK